MKWFNAEFFKFNFKKLPQRVFVVSFPRSGHHAMVGFLTKISDFSESYCEFYHCARHNGAKIECVKENIHWRLKQSRCGAGNKRLKNHDFNLSLPHNSYDKFIIQYRHPFYSINSWYELENKDGKNIEPWPIFFKNKLKFWIKFIEKWVIKYGNKPNVLLVPYNSLADKTMIIDIAKFSDSNISGIEKLGNNYFRKTRELADTDGFYSEQEQKIAPLLAKAGISLLFS